MSPAEREGPAEPGRAVEATSPDAELDLEEELTLVELVNRVLDRGVVLRGEAVLSVAGIDLVYLGLDVLLSSVETMQQKRIGTLHRREAREGEG